MKAPADGLRRMVDPATFRRTVSNFATGLTVITGLDDEQPVGFTCQSFFSVSLDPPLVAFSVMKGSQTYTRLRRRGSFAVNVLASQHVAVSEQFSQKGRTGWGTAPWMPAPSGNPTLPEALVWLDCRIRDQHDGGDHLIVVGQVLAVGASEQDSGEALVYFRGAYHSVVPRT